MPKLEGNVKACYIAAYDPKANECYRDDNGIDTVHGSKLTFPDSDEVQRHFVHRPDHDMESIFWVLLFVLIVAEPKDGSGTWDKTSNKEVYTGFKEHTIKKNSANDSRSFILNWNKKKLTSALDPKFRSLGPMLHEMGRQIAPEYAYLEKEPPKDHLHEAMRRLLLRYILEMKDPIELDPKAVLVKKTLRNECSGAGDPSSKKSMSIVQEQLMSLRRLSVAEKGSKASGVDSQPEDTPQEASVSRSNNGGSQGGDKSQSTTRRSQRGRKAT